MMREIPERELVLDDNNLVDFLLYRVYHFYRPNSVPNNVRQNFWELESNTIDDIITFFEKFLQENDDLNILESVRVDFKNVFFTKKHSKTGNIETIWKYLLSLLDNKIEFEKSQEQVKNRIRWISNVSMESTQILLEDWNFDFDNWNEIYERYIVSLSAILSFKELEKYDFIDKYRKSFLPESRGKKHVFVKIEHFFLYFQIEKFYKELLKVIKNTSWKDNEIIKNALKEHLCRFETQNNKKYPCLKLQEEIFK